VFWHVATASPIVAMVVATAMRLRSIVCSPPDLDSQLWSFQAGLTLLIVRFQSHPEAQQRSGDVVAPAVRQGRLSAATEDDDREPEFGR
jgi:hypothetical protein